MAGMAVAWGGGVFKEQAPDEVISDDRSVEPAEPKVVGRCDEVEIEEDVNDGITDIEGPVKHRDSGIVMEEGSLG